MSFHPMEIEPINASQQSLGHIFSDEYAFSIPPYQRPYAWEVTQARELLNDVAAALTEAKESKDPVTYFLGSIVLVKKPGAPMAQVVDGQQRLTTLTILLSVLRDLSAEKIAIKRHAYICEEGDPDKGTHDRFRLIPRKKDANFFHEHIQIPGSTGKTSGDEGESDSQRAMVANALLFKDELGSWTESERNDLVAFLVQRCYLVVISVTNVDTAHRVFTVLNARGLDLTPTDILKANLLDRVLKENEERFAQQWEDFETALGRDRFVDLFQHIRMIYQQEKPRERLEIGFPKHVTLFNTDPDGFLKDVLAKYAKAYITILTPGEVARRFGERAQALISHLLKLDNSDWVPIALDYLSIDKHSQEEVNTFLFTLERLAYFMFVMREDINGRILRYAAANKQLRSGLSPLDETCKLSLSSREKDDFLSELDGPIYEKARVRLPLLLRLDAALTDGGATYQHGVVTVEHVLPQNPKADSPWLTMFKDDEERYGWTHCLGNLVLLTRAKNSQASNWDFERKKSEYFSSKGGVSSFRLTTMVIKEKTWDKSTLERRHYELLEKLSEVWDLDIKGWYEK